MARRLMPPPWLSTADADWSLRLRSPLAGFSTVKLFFFLPFYTVLLGSRLLAQPTLEWAVTLLLLENIYVHSLEFFCMGDWILPSPPPFIYSSHYYLYQCGLVNIYFARWGLAQYYFTYCAQWKELITPILCGEQWSCRCSPFVEDTKSFV